jgi:hypothetical protein
MKQIFLIPLIFLFLFPCLAQEVKESTPTEFARLIKLKGVKLTNLDITIKPKAFKIAVRKLKTAINGDTSILSIPVEITNSSSQTISMSLNHEWYGGIWAPTDFYIASEVLDWEKKAVWDERPAYQVGNLDKTNQTVLKPNQSITIDVRLNWHGTGSVPIEPLIDESTSGKHIIKFLLLFKTDASEEYLITENYTVYVET